MKKGIFIFIVLFSSSAFGAAEPNAIVELQKSIKQLDTEISHLLKIIELQKKEIEFLRKLCVKAGINVTPVPEGISEPVSGVYLGESLDTLRTRRRVVKSNYTFTQKDYPGQVWSVENNDVNISSVLAYSFDEQIYELDIEFADANAAKCEEIKSQLKNNNFKAVYQNTFETIIDGVNIGIELKCAGENGKTTLTYIHVPLLREIYTELDNQKAKDTQAEKPKKKKAKKNK